MDENTLNTAGSNNIEVIKVSANKLILILEDMIEIISSSSDISSLSIKLIKERASSAKMYLKNLKENMLILDNLLPSEDYDSYRKELDIYNSEYMDDVITAWMLNGAKDIVTDSLYIACYRIRELLRKL